MEILRLASLVALIPLRNEQLVRIAPHASERVIAPGRRLLLDGPFGQELAFVATGRGIVRCAGEVVADFGPGDVFGELAPQRPAYETATVTAITELRLVVLSGRGIRILHTVAPATVEALLAACALAPVAPVEAAAGLRPVPRLTLVRSAA
jgi:CRP-like cAMP-binding protein